jgi:hypothetical protein
MVISFAVELQAGIACKSGASVCALCKRRVALREAQVKLVLTEVVHLLPLPISQLRRLCIS